MSHMGIIIIKTTCLPTQHHPSILKKKKTKNYTIRSDLVRWHVTYTHTMYVLVCVCWWQLEWRHFTCSQFESLMGTFILKRCCEGSSFEYILLFCPRTCSCQPSQVRQSNFFDPFGRILIDGITRDTRYDILNASMSFVLHLATCIRRK